MIGQTVSHYRIVEMLGSGGMGVVYKALDTKLDRPVALKFLPAEFSTHREAKRRFEQEARAASALQHSSICTIHEIDETDDGRMFIVMDYYEGQTLSERLADGPLAVSEAIDIAAQLAEGLAAAHDAGIVHRDIKSPNIIVTNGGAVKILDFGLAKLSGNSRVTRTGATLGTVAYMSPEQAKGEEVDSRSDIFSLGIVLYELLVGRLPFTGDHQAALLYSIVHGDPKPVHQSRHDLPDRLERILDGTLEKDREQRYRSAAELAAELRQCQASVAGTGYPRRSLRPLSRKALLAALMLIPILAVTYAAFLRPSSKENPGPPLAAVAVLPFVNLTSDPEDEYLSDGITEDLIHRLAKVEELRVVSRTSAFQFKGKTGDIRDIGEKLGVRAVLEGTVRRYGDRLVITANLIDATSGLEIWSDRFERRMADVFAIQYQISQSIVEELTIPLTGAEDVTEPAPYTENMDAYAAYLKGRYQWNMRSPESLARARDFFEEALAIDSRFGLAYAGLADVYLMMANYSNATAGNGLYAKARASAQKAMELDDTLAEAYASHALVSWIYDWDWEKADREFARASDLKPAYATTHHWRAMFLAFMGRYDEAVAEIDKAVARDPVSLIINAAAALLRYCAGDYEAALGQCARTLEMDPEFNPAVTTMARACIQTERYGEAITWLEKSLQIAGRRTNTLAFLSYAFALADRRAEAKDILEELESKARAGEVEPCYMALVHTGLGDRETALDWLAKIQESRGFGIFVLQTEPALAALRSSPEYARTMQSIGFPIP